MTPAEESHDPYRHQRRQTLCSTYGARNGPLRSQPHDTRFATCSAWKVTIPKFADARPQISGSLDFGRLERLLWGFLLFFFLRNHTIGP